MSQVIDQKSRECARLLSRFEDRMEVDPVLSRQLVSFQANSDEPFYRWFKYKEGFSAELVRYLMRRFAGKRGALLDPFAGSGASLFAARAFGWRTIGIEVLPVGVFAMNARLAAERVAAPDLLQAVEEYLTSGWRRYPKSSHPFPHVPITAGAFPIESEQDLMGFQEYCDAEIDNEDLKLLLRFASFAVLEDISYTRKDGQYLRWDARSGRRRLKGSFDKGAVPGFRDALRKKVDQMAADMQGAEDTGQRILQFSSSPSRRRYEPLIYQGTCLEVLPLLNAQSVDFVLTSPPYCNRYDYTRTYALELAFLGTGAHEMGALRQAMLSCTVENKAKVEELRLLYASSGNSEAFDRVDSVFSEQASLQEVLNRLEELRRSDGLNNTNIPRMVRNYFYEMCFVIYEMARSLRSGGVIAVVNDNVRYGGVEVPTDLILSDMAESFGLVCRKILVLPRGKGNSSQQMGRHGRQELRKCVYVWGKDA